MMQRTSTSLRIVLVTTLTGLALAGCQSSPFATNSPANVPIALESIEGAPDTVKTELASALATAAAAQKITVVPSETARYRIKGYVTAYGRQDGHTEISYVWDVFDGDKRRAKRIEGVSAAEAKAGDNAWASVDPAALNKLATASMSQVASFLSTDAGTATAAIAPAPEPTTVAASTTSPAETSALGFAGD